MSNQKYRITYYEWWVISSIRKDKGEFKTTDSPSSMRLRLTPYESALLEGMRTMAKYEDGNWYISRNAKEIIVLNKTTNKIYTKVISTYQKRTLFFDIETSLMKAYTFYIGRKVNLNYKQILEDWKVIFISYKWLGEKEVYNIRWDGNMNDTSMLREFIEIANSAEELIGHNSDSFDIRKLRTRCAKLGINMFPSYKTLDTYKKAKSTFKFDSNALDYLGRYFEIGKKMPHEGLDLWIKCGQNDKDALKIMCDYCDQDVLLLEGVYNKLLPYISSNSHIGVQLGKDKWSCAICGDENVEFVRTVVTAKGTIQRVVRCLECGHTYTISNRSFQLMIASKHE